MTRYHTQEYIFLLKLAEELLAANPNVTAKVLQVEMHVSESAAYLWLKRARAGVVAEDPVAKTRAYLKAHPKARIEGVAAHLGIKRRSAYGYFARARKDLAKEAAAEAARRAVGIPCFIQLKEWP